MMPFLKILLLLVIGSFTAAFVTVCAGAVRSVVIRLLRALSIHFPEPIQPLFDPSASPVDFHPEYAFWQIASVTILGISTMVFAFYLFDIVTQLWDLFITR